MIEGRDFAVATTLGARDRQEDEWGTHLDPPALEEGPLLLAAVADGMGGMPAGNQASDIAVRAFFDSYPQIKRSAPDRLCRALAYANREVGFAVEADPSLEGMGCTLVAALFFEDRCEWLSVGDSLILLCRDGKMERINPFHIYANELDAKVEQGEITLEEARDHPDRKLLTSAMQGGLLDEVAQGQLSLQPGDLILLASDGIASLCDEEIISICTDRVDLGAAAIAEMIVAQIDGLERAGQDNATVIVVRHVTHEVVTSRLSTSDEGREAQDLEVDRHAIELDRVSARPGPWC